MSDVDFRIFSQKRKSFLFGSQYLHEPIPGISDFSDYEDITYITKGSPADYRRKVHGDAWDGVIRPEDFEPHDRAWDSLKLDPVDGRVRSREPYAELPRGRRFVASLFPLHSGSWFGMPGRVVAVTAALLMPLFALSGLWMWVLRRRNDALRRSTASARQALDARIA